MLIVNSSETPSREEEPLFDSLETSPLDSEDSLFDIFEVSGARRSKALETAQEYERKRANILLASLQASFVVPLGIGAVKFFLFDSSLTQVTLEAAISSVGLSVLSCFIPAVLLFGTSGARYLRALRHTDESLYLEAAEHIRHDTIYFYYRAKDGRRAEARKNRRLAKLEAKREKAERFLASLEA